MPVLIGITIATALVHAVSVLVGAAARARRIPTRADHVRRRPGVHRLRALDAARRRARPRTTSERAAQPAAHVVLTVGAVFFLAELGDKTMLATITLATREGLFGTWLGSTLGMVAADALAIGVGRLLGTRLPERTIRIGAAVSFFVFAALLLFEAARLPAARCSERPCQRRGRVEADDRAPAADSGVDLALPGRRRPP